LHGKKAEREKRRKRQQNVKLYIDILVKKLINATRGWLYIIRYCDQSVLLLKHEKSHESCAENKKEKKGEKKKKEKKIRQI